MNNNRIDAVLAWLAPRLLMNTDPLELRSWIEDLYNGAQDDLLTDLIGAEQAAARWDVSERRARAHIARLHEKYGVGWQFGGSWMLRRQDVERHMPDRKYRAK